MVGLPLLLFKIVEIFKPEHGKDKMQNFPLPWSFLPPLTPQWFPHGEAVEVTLGLRGKSGDNMPGSTEFVS